MTFFHTNFSMDEGRHDLHCVASSLIHVAALEYSLLLSEHILFHKTNSKLYLLTNCSVLYGSEFVVFISNKAENASLSTPCSNYTSTRIATSANLHIFQAVTESSLLFVLWAVFCTTSQFQNTSLAIDT